MKLSEVLSISGQPGLFKYVAQSKAGIIVESVVDNRRFPVSATAKVSSLSDISIFTYEEDMPLGDVFQVIYTKNEGKEIVEPKKMSNDQFKSTMASFIESYDEDRVHISDMKKLFSWYNILVAAGMTAFTEKEEGEEESVATEIKKSAAKTATPKAAASKSKVQASSKSKSSSKVRTIKAS